MVTKKIFLDTNIVLDFIDTSRKDSKKALELFRYLISLDYDIYISEDMLSTIYYIAKDKNRALIFIKDIVLVDWNVLPFGKGVILNATNYALENSCDLEDTLQCFCAKNSGCDILLTSDKKFIACGIDILDYDGFLNG